MDTKEEDFAQTRAVIGAGFCSLFMKFHTTFSILVRSCPKYYVLCPKYYGRDSKVAFRGSL